MENNQDYTKKDQEVKNQQPASQPEEQDTEFENPSTDPGFETTDDGLSGREDKRSGNIDSNKSIKDMQEDKQNDALNYNNDRENGAYNPKNI